MTFVSVPSSSMLKTVSRPYSEFFTGTPSGVGPVARGDNLVAEIEGEVVLDFFAR